jgi:penicillin-binding protein 1C
LAELDNAQTTGPKLIFPPDGASVQVERLGPEARGLVLAARGTGLSWYVEGQPIEPDPLTGRAVWRPAAQGFYRLTVVDGDGREAKARVRIRGR